VQGSKYFVSATIVFGVKVASLDAGDLRKVQILVALLDPMVPSLIEATLGCQAEE
jgi:hypothetical protein